MRASSRGNALTEYGLIAGAVVVVAIAAITLTGNNIASHLGGMGGGMKTQIANAKSVKAPAFNSPTSSVTNPGANPGGGALAPAPVPATIGPVTIGPAELEFLKGSLAKKIETAGANGTTRILAGTIEAIAQQLFDAKEISQQQYDILMQLANKGHEMAEVERLLEGAIASVNGDTSKLDGMKLEFQGKTYEAGELYRWVGESGANINSPELESMETVGGEQPGKLASEFLALYEKALGTGGTLDDPLVKATINSLSLQIIATGENFDGLIHDSLNNERDLPNEDNLNKELASEITDYSSSEICAAGDFKDSGTMCQPGNSGKKG